jgi:glycosyltransferase involved in cell wall biosynthesis
MLHGLLITYRRPAELAQTLARLATQSRRLDRLVVVDNHPTPENRELVRAAAAAGTAADYVGAPENLGPAGGIALGVRAIDQFAADQDWIVLLDDDNPPATSSLLEDLEAFGERIRRQDSSTGAVGLVGARFDPRAGRLRRVPDTELVDGVAVDYVGGGQFPFYRVEAVRAVGNFREDLFFGFDDLEYGLRLRAAGYAVYAHGALWREERRRQGRLGLTVRPAAGVSEPSWRRYYSLRNLIAILRSSGNTRGALRVTLVTGLAAPALNLARRPRLAARNLALNARACRHAWTGRMGRTVEPAQPHADPTLARDTRTRPA